MEVKEMFLRDLEKVLTQTLGEDVGENFPPMEIKISWNRERKSFVIGEILPETIPICSNCKNVRDQNEKWKPVEDYLMTKKIQCSHGLCRPCAKKLYPEFYPD